MFRQLSLWLVTCLVLFGIAIPLFPAVFALTNDQIRQSVPTPDGKKSMEQLSTTEFPDLKKYGANAFPTITNLKLGNQVTFNIAPPSRLPSGLRTDYQPNRVFRKYESAVVYKAIDDGSGKALTWTRVKEFKELLAKHTNTVTDSPPAAKQTAIYALRYKLYYNDSSREDRHDYWTTAGIATLTPPISTDAEANRRAGGGGLFLSQPTPTHNNGKVTTTLKWEFTSSFLATLQNHYVTNIYISIQTNPALGSAIEAAGFIQDYRLRGFSTQAILGGKGPLGEPNGHYYYPLPNSQNFGPNNGADILALNKENSITIKNLPGQRTDGIKQGYTFFVVVARAAGAPSTYGGLLVSNTVGFDVAPDGTVSQTVDSAGNPVEFSGGSAAQTVGLKCGLSSGLNVIARAFNDVSCIIAEVYATFFDFLTDRWINSAAKLEDISENQGLYDGQGVDGGTGGLSSQEQADCLNFGIDAADCLKRKQQTTTTPPTIPPIAKPTIKPPPPINRGKQSSLSPALHQLLGIKTARATLSQELNPRLCEQYAPRGTANTRGGAPCHLVIGAWRAVLFVANTMVALLILVIAIANIAHINIEAYGARKALPGLILGIIAANFSLTGIRFLIDISNAFAQFFKEAPGIPQELTGTLGQNLALSLNVLGLTANQIANGDALGLVTGGLFVAAALQNPVGLFIISLLPLTMAAVALLAVGAVLWARIVVIYVLTILAPVAMLAYGLPFPAIQSQAKTWLTTLLNWIFAFPIIMFFLWLAGLPGAFGATGTFISFAIALVICYFAAITPFKLLGLEKQIKSALGGTAGAAWKGYGSAMARLGKIGQDENGLPTGNAFARRAGAYFRGTNLYGLPQAIKQSGEQAEKDRLEAGSQGFLSQRIAGDAYIKQTAKDEREKWSGANDIDTLRNQFNLKAGGITRAQYQQLRRARTSQQFRELARQTGHSVEDLIAAKEIDNRTRGMRGTEPIIAARDAGAGTEGVVPYGRRRSGGAAGAPTGPLPTPGSTTEQVRTMTTEQIPEINDFDRQEILTTFASPEAKQSLEDEAKEAVAPLTGAGNQKIAPEFASLNEGQRAKLGNIITSAVNVDLTAAIAADPDLQAALQRPENARALTAARQLQEQAKPALTAKRNVELLEFQQSLGAVDQEETVARQHGGFELPVVNRNIAQLDSALQLIRGQNTLTPESISTIQQTLRSVSIKKIDNQGNVRNTSLGADLSQTVLTDKTKLTAILESHRAAAQIVVQNPNRAVADLYTERRVKLMSDQSAGVATKQITALVGTTVPQNFKSQTIEAPIRQTVTNHLTSYLKERNITVDAQRLNADLASLTSAIGSKVGASLTAGQPLNAASINQLISRELTAAAPTLLSRYQARPAARTTTQPRPATSSRQGQPLPPQAGGTAQRRGGPQPAEPPEIPELILPDAAVESTPREVITAKVINDKAKGGRLRSAKDITR